ncbi:hypothetical protein [Candidatus Rickettsiella viridis]|uniref:hypothetical protein n=1 Tax=Candidatus Rickettsiella viridis TaxID=676208 RepID=UPI000F84ABCD|nr:hypothetical protein [Candidatus Rickettsiella viridis]
MKTNQLFCYWLQGYFEIGINVTIQRNGLRLIKNQLDLIEEPLDTFTSWLKDVCDYIKRFGYSNALCAHFSPIIELSLNSVFHHVIDNSYVTETPREVLHRIHDGKYND